MAYDPDFSPDGWQRLPRATRDAFIKSSLRPLKERIYFYCLQVWDAERGDHGFGGKKNVPILESHLVAATGADKGAVSVAVHEMQDEGLIEIGAEHRIYPVENPVFKKPKYESEAAAVKAFWAKFNRKEYDAFIAWESAGAPHKQAFRKARKEMKRQAADGPAKTVDPNGSTEKVVDPIEHGAGPTVHPLVEREKSKKLASETANPLAAAIAEMQTQGVWTKFGTPTAATIKNLLKHGEPDEIAALLVRTWRERRDWNGWGAVVKAAREDLPALRAQPAAVLAPPEEALTPEREIRTTAEFIGHNPSHEQCPEQVEYLRQLQIENPELAQSIMREFEQAQPELARVVQQLLDGAENTAAGGAGG